MRSDALRTAHEPILTEEDLCLWNAWSRAALAHARTRLHARRVDEARRIAVDAMTADQSAHVDDWYVGWSAGKDSTALVHLLRVDLGMDDIAVMSVKDDLDFPGEEEYLTRWATAWGIRVDIVRPRFSLQDLLAARGEDLDASEDFHGRAAELSREGFYPIIDEYVKRTGRNRAFLGLRAEESFGRSRNVAMNGVTYTRKSDGVTVCQPLARWTGLDVFGYLLSREIEPLHVYRCLALHHGDAGRVRKSWWVPGANTRHGGMVWLRRYYPSLHRKLCELLPSAGRYA